MSTRNPKAPVRRPRRTARKAAPRRVNYLTLPIGSPLEGGLFAGITYVEGRPHALVLGPEHETALTWQAAVEWAPTVRVGRVKNFVLPSPLDLALLYAHLGREFRETGYWSGEQHASDSDYAWYQDFGLGYQGRWNEFYKLRARLVRRSPI